eukprot:4438911-Pyramimonas_sp.AAC.1
MGWSCPFSSCCRWAKRRWTGAWSEMPRSYSTSGASGTSARAHHCNSIHGGGPPPSCSSAPAPKPAGVQGCVGVDE